jgi:hypothetical protein
MMLVEETAITFMRRSMASEQEVRAKLADAESFIRSPDGIWPLRYQDGVARTLRWLLGDGRDPLAPLEPVIEPRVIDLRHRLPDGWKQDFAKLQELLPLSGRQRGGAPVTVIPWLPRFLEETVPQLLSEMYTFGPLELDPRLGQHVLVVGTEWFPWHTHGFADSFLSFVLYPCTHPVHAGGEIALSTGDTFTPREGYAIIFDGRATAHCVRETIGDAPIRYSITAFYRAPTRDSTVNLSCDGRANNG